MRHRLKGRKLGRITSHREMLGRNLVTNLFAHGRIVTTLQKAKEFRGKAEKMITLAKKGGLANYRRALGFIQDENVVKKLFNDIKDRFSDRAGGYTRVIRLGGYRFEAEKHGKFASHRLGDMGERAIWELVVHKDHDEELYLAGLGAKAREERDKKKLDKKKKLETKK